MTRDYQNVIAGMILASVGLATAVHSYTSYSVGTFSRAGPGLFPSVLGVILFGLGLMIAIRACFRESGGPLNLNIRAMGAILAGVIWFAFTIGPFGLVVAVVGLTTLSVLAEGRFDLRFATLLSLALCILGYLVFRMVLGFQLILFSWPW